MTEEKWSPKPAGGSETILVVEDEDGVRALVKRTLETIGYTVLTASRGSEALEIARSHPAPIDLLVTDMIMPGMGGSELAEQLLLIRPLVRLLFMSGYTEDSIARQGLMHQGQTLLYKPFTIQGLALAVREALDAPLDR